MEGKVTLDSRYVSVLFSWANPPLWLFLTLKKRIFEQGDHFAVIMERLQGRKKLLQRKNEVAWENRLIAKEITAHNFRELILTSK